MHRELVDEGLPIGRRRTARLMRENGLAARQKRRFKRTTDSTHSERFLELMTEHYPAWREARAELNELPLAAEVWNE